MAYVYKLEFHLGLALNTAELQTHYYVAESEQVVRGIWDGAREMMPESHRPTEGAITKLGDVVILLSR